MDDAAIHRVSGDANGFVCSCIKDQWIATGLRPRDDKGKVGVGYGESVDRHARKGLAMTRVVFLK